MSERAQLRKLKHKRKKGRNDTNRGKMNNFRVCKGRKTKPQQESKSALWLTPAS